MPRPGAWRCAAIAATVVSLTLAPAAARADQATTSTHVVEPGETLSEIADALGLDSAALVTLNGLDDANVLVAGQALRVPAGTAAVAATATAATTMPASAASSRTVTVVEGDTLWGIAQRFGTTASALAQANGLDDADRLALGAGLTLPAGATASASTTAGAASAASAAGAASTGSAANVATAAEADPVQTQASAPKRSLLVPYTVQAGETLTQVAHQFGVRADAIARAS
ncbi:MAG: LysM peptidoglycan-binding domain-containing protein, partial [Chloroflexi bacterium]